MRYVKVFEAWSEEKEEEVSHQDLYEMLEELVNAWKEWKENDDEDKDEEELHDEFMEKVEDLIERAKEIVEEEEEEDEEGSDESEESEESEESDEMEEKPEDEDEDEDSDEDDLEEAHDPYLDMPDLSKKEGTIANRLEPVFRMMDSMSLGDLHQTFIQIMNDPELIASQKTRNKNVEIANEIMNTGLPEKYKKERLMKFITGLYTRGSRLSANPKDYRP
jgi:hypothetical protein